MNRPIPHLEPGETARLAHDTVISTPIPAFPGRGRRRAAGSHRTLREEVTGRCSLEFPKSTFNKEEGAPPRPVASWMKQGASGPHLNRLTDCARWLRLRSKVLPARGTPVRGAAQHRSIVRITGPDDKGSGYLGSRYRLAYEDCSDLARLAGIGVLLSYPIRSRGDIRVRDVTQSAALFLV